MAAWWIIALVVLLAVSVRRSGGLHDEDMMHETATYSAKVKRFAEAIAVAEGFYVAGDKPNLPQRSRNPGNLKVSSVPSVGRDPGGHLEFATDADGWRALHRQLQIIIDGRSRYYNLDMTIEAMAKSYAGWWSNWSQNVARVLDVPTTTPLRNLLV